MVRQVVDLVAETVGGIAHRLAGKHYIAGSHGIADEDVEVTAGRTKHFAWQSYHLDIEFQAKRGSELCKFIKKMSCAH